MKKKRLLGLMATLFVTPSLLSFSGTPGHEFDDEPFVINYIRGYDAEEGEPVRYTCSISYKQAGLFRLCVKYRVRTGWADVILDFGAQGYVKRHPGESSFYAWTLLPEMYQANSGYFSLIVYDGYETSSCSISIQVPTAKPKSENISSVSGNGYFSWSRINYEYNGVDFTTVSAKKLEYCGMPSNMRDTVGNSVGLNRMGLRTTMPWGEVVGLEYDSITLYMLGSHPEISIGRIGFYGNQDAVVFPLVADEPDESGFSFLRTAEESYLSADGRYQSRVAPENGKARISTDVHFPPVEFGQTDIYDFVLVLEGVGNGNCMTITYPFSYYKTTNGFGYCHNSLYCIVEDK